MKLFIIGFVVGYIFRVLLVKVLKWYMKNKDLFEDFNHCVKEFKNEYRILNSKKRVK